MIPAHNVSWMGEQWECLCGFLTGNDGGAYHHYNEVAGHGGVTRYTEMQMGSEGQFSIEPITEMEMAFD